MLHQPLFGVFSPTISSTTSSSVVERGTVDPQVAGSIPAWWTCWPDGWFDSCLWWTCWLAGLLMFFKFPAAFFYTQPVSNFPPFFTFPPLPPSPFALPPSPCPFTFAPSLRPAHHLPNLGPSTAIRHLGRHYSTPNRGSPTAPTITSSGALTASWQQTSLLLVTINLKLFCCQNGIYLLYGCLVIFLQFPSIH